MAERASSWFFLIVTPAAIGAFVWHTRQSGLDHGILSALAVVLIACPCALALATPLAVWTALARAAGEQVVLKGGDALERLARVKAVCFDKTGTLTTGHPRVVDFVAADTGQEWSTLAVAAAIARSSNHVFSTAISEFADGCHRPQIFESRTVAGRGILARVEGRDDWAYLGSLHFVEEARLSLDERIGQTYRAALAEGQPAAFVGWDGRVQGVFIFSETVRPGANALLQACEAAGLSCAMLTGDHWQRARSLQADLGIPVAAELLPEEKVRNIREIHDRVGLVAMVGDGINDAPALAAADIGIALGCGADLSRDSADICLMGNDLGRLPWLFGLAQATVRTIRFNLFWAFGYNVFGIGLAMTGRLNPILAALLMVASSACVLTNSLRLRRFNLEPMQKTPDRIGQSPPLRSLSPLLGEVSASRQVAAARTMETVR